jgi:hypothetical protein
VPARLAERAARYQAKFGRTHAFLPARDGIRPNTLHVILHVATLVIGLAWHADLSTLVGWRPRLARVAAGGDAGCRKGQPGTVRWDFFHISARKSLMTINSTNLIYRVAEYLIGDARLAV